MNIRKMNEAIPLIGTLFGGFIFGVIVQNSFVDWTGETLLAGFLGLGGGWLAYRAATYQQRAIEASNSLAFRFKYRADIRKADYTLQYIIKQGIGKWETNLGTFYQIYEKISEILSSPHVVDTELTEILSNCTDSTLKASEICAPYYERFDSFFDPTIPSRPVPETKTALAAIQELATQVRRLRDYCG